jgi:hypothetical protein
MNNRDMRDYPKKGPAADLEGGFATTAAGMLAMIAAPAMYEMTAKHVVWLAQKSYSQEFVHIIEFAWMIACFPFVFFAARAGIAAALTVAGVYLAYRFI